MYFKNKNKTTNQITYKTLTSKQSKEKQKEKQTNTSQKRTTKHQERLQYSIAKKIEQQI